MSAFLVNEKGPDPLVSSSLSDLMASSSHHRKNPAALSLVRRPKPIPPERKDMNHSPSRESLPDLPNEAHPIPFSENTIDPENQ